MSVLRIENLIKFLKNQFKDGIQMFNTPSLTHSFRLPIYIKDEIAVLWPPYYEYIEIYGISNEEFERIMRDAKGYCECPL